MKTNTNILLSFIIPVYNVERYLNECVESIRNQITEQCEIILVNDGSIDSSGDICFKYANIDDRIKVINQQNQGAAIARNKGLLSARGEYVAFVDSDDKIAEDCIVKILSWIESNSCDMCFMQIDKLYPNGVLENMGECLEREKIYSMNKAEVIAHLASRPKFTGSACSKIYRKSFLIDNNLYFPEDGLIGEDLVFVRDVLLRGNEFDFLDFPYYQYRQMRTGSVTNVVNYKNFKAISRFITKSVSILTEDRMPLDNSSKYMMSFVAYEYLIILWQYNFLEAKEKAEAYVWLKNHLWVTKYAQNRKSKMMRIFVRVLGIEVTAKVLGIYMKITKKLMRY